MRGGAILGLLVGAEAAVAECAPLDALDAFAVSGAPPDGARCSTYLTAAGNTGASCHWEFAFREDAALVYADDLWSALTTCRPGETLGADQLVNHPDSYDLREWATPDSGYFISVKDKGALNRTLVFLRVEPN